MQICLKMNMTKRRLRRSWKRMVMEACGNGHLMVQDVRDTVYEYGHHSGYSIPVFLGPELIESGHRTLLPNQMTEISNFSD